MPKYGIFNSDEQNKGFFIGKYILDGEIFIMWGNSNECREYLNPSLAERAIKRLKTQNRTLTDLSVKRLEEV